MNTSLRRTLLPAALGVATALGATACGSASPDNHNAHLTTFHAAPTGRISGIYFTEGGVAPGDVPWGLTGTLTITPQHGHTITVKIGKDGKFSVVVPVGSYTVHASSPRWEGDCAPSESTTVIANQTSTVSLGCYIP